ncbi:hypothetical protein FPH17_07785 [Corynebacterium godavarianum]|uniref:PAS domain-containing protein n=1 Tax=Corynebacterium godavarianum TaxID=2054421 RepID=A0ABY3E108_9CORY|nr:PAS domain-containing protein [Corynebacterium godavarianum]MBL7285185.1 hypothetical protein [Corynebacterium godavarianum]TSJ73297.1 hypothetical protein FPH17_07785 [Corynebacterium godavarianum]
MAYDVILDRDVTDGPQHLVEVDDIFFSVTDAKGIMTDVNEVFIYYAQYPLEEMIGKPHNLIRQDEMPGGAFKAMWDWIQAGKPFAAYVRNLAKSGSAYDVLATVTPLPGDRYLSVRTRPMTHYFQDAAKVYQEANVVEHKAKAEGVGRRRRAELGWERICEFIPDYDAFMAEILPAEVAAREEAGFVLPEGEGEVYEATAALYAELESFMGIQTSIKQSAEELSRACQTLLEENAVTNRVKGEMENVVAEGATRTLLLAPLQVWATMRGIIDENAQSLAEVAEELQDRAAKARTAIALARLHAAQTATFSAEEDRIESMQMLYDAMEVALRDMDNAVFLHSSLANRVELKVNSISELTKMPLEMIRRWSQSTAQQPVGQSIDPLVAQVEQAIQAADASIAQLQLSSKDLGEDPSVDGVHDALERLRRAVY